MSGTDVKLDKIIRQNEIMISLLGRIAFTKEEVKEIVTQRKQNPENYVKGYNACDGEYTLSELAKIIDVKPGTLSPILSDWEEIGIIYEVVKRGGKFYKKLFQI